MLLIWICDHSLWFLVIQLLLLLWRLKCCCLVNVWLFLLIERYVVLSHSLLMMTTWASCHSVACVRVMTVYMYPVCVGGMPLSPTAASTTVGSPTPFTYSCSVASLATPGTGDTLSVFDLNKPANGQHYDPDSTVPPVYYSHPSFLPRSVCTVVCIV